MGGCGGCGEGVGGHGGHGGQGGHGGHGGRGGLWGGDVWLWLETREGCGAHGGCGRCPPLSPQGGCGCGGSARQHIAAPPHRTRRRLPLLVAAGTERVSARPHRQRGWVGAAPRQPPMSAHNTPSLCPSVSLCVPLCHSVPIDSAGGWELDPHHPIPISTAFGWGSIPASPHPTDTAGGGWDPRHPTSPHVILCHPMSPHITPHHPMSSHVTPCHPMSPHVTPYHPTSPHPT